MQDLDDQIEELTAIIDMMYCMSSSALFISQYYFEENF